MTDEENAMFDRWDVKKKKRAKAVKDLMDELGIDKATLIGNSMGGASSLAFALNWPERLTKMILMGPGGAGQSIFTPMPLEGIKLLFNLYKNPSIEGLRRMIEVFVYDPSKITDDLIQGRFDAMMANKHHLENFVKAMESSGGLLTDYTSRLGEIASFAVNYSQICTVKYCRFLPGTILKFGRLC